MHAEPFLQHLLPQATGRSLGHLGPQVPLFRSVQRTPAGQHDGPQQFADGAQHFVIGLPERSSELQTFVLLGQQNPLFGSAHFWPFGQQTPSPHLVSPGLHSFRYSQPVGVQTFSNPSLGNFWAQQTPTEVPTR